MRRLLVAGLFWLITSSCASAQVITFVGAAEIAHADPTTSVSGSYTVGSGANRRLWAGVQSGVTGLDALETPACTYNSVSMTLALANEGGNSLFKTYLFYLNNPASGSNTLTCTTTTSRQMGLLAADYAGVATGIDNTVASQDSISEDTYTSALTTVADNAWVIVFTSQQNDGTGSVVAGTNATLRVASALGGAVGNWALFDSNAAVHPPASLSMATTMPRSNPGSWNQSHSMASFAPAAGTSDKGSMMMMGCCR